MSHLIYQGSTKNIYQIDEQTLEFEFTDDYSIFDYGKMPDQIPGKGIALCSMAEKSFKELKASGIQSHFISRTRLNKIRVQHFHVPEIYRNEKYDYTFYQKKPENTLIPLEVVFRLGLPKGSSQLKTGSQFKTNYPDYPCYENARFEKPILQFYTKLERLDRELLEKEAQSLAGLTDSELKSIKTITIKIIDYLEKKFRPHHFQLWDGKFEFAFGKEIQGHREIILVDSIGPDELRLTKEGEIYSKEKLRQFYADSSWLAELQQMKKIAPLHFKEKLKSKPHPLTSAQIEETSGIYHELKNIFTSSVMVLGKGGREHALAKHLSESPFCDHVYVVPGNPGMVSDNISICELNEDLVLEWCQTKGFDFVVIGPENTISSEFNTRLRDHQIPVYAPTQAASILESSKQFSKSFMSRYDIPTASFANFNDKQSAKDFLQQSAWEKIVLKKSGLFAGKGVFICENKEHALQNLELYFSEHDEMVIEECLSGPEVSYFALCLDNEFKILGHACDYKRLKDGDQGPNTGGMGCYSPAFWLTSEQEKEIEHKIIRPTLQGMQAEGLRFQGTLFIGLMMTKEGPKVLEYNVRFGDPETQTLLPRLESNLFELFQAVAYQNKTLFKKHFVHIKNLSSIHIVKAAQGYPGIDGETIEADQPISGDYQNSEFIKLYFAGVKKKDHQLVTAGGRVLGFTSLASSHKDARELAYKNLERVFFKGEQFRGDIGL